MTQKLKLYFSPLACSLSSRIALYEAGADAEFVPIDPDTKLTPDGRDYLGLHSLGLVPLLELPNGEIIAENAAVLQYITEHLAGGRLAPSDAAGRTRLQQYLSFIGSELHKAIYLPLLDRHAPEVVKAYALDKVAKRFGWLSERLANRRHLLDDFSVADAYLLAVLNWSRVTPVDLDEWPVLRAYEARLHERPAVQRAFTEELELYRAQQARRGLFGTHEARQRRSRHRSLQPRVLGARTRAAPGNRRSRLCAREHRSGAGRRASSGP